MSTSSVGSNTPATSSNQYATGDSLTSLGTGSPLQVTGLASGLDTNAIVTALMQADQQQVTVLTNQQSGLTAENTQLTSIQTALQGVASDAQALMDPSLFADTQAVTSTNATLVGATATSGSGAVEGGYQIGVTQLASSAQKTFDFNAQALQSAGDTITIDNQTVTLAQGGSASDLVSAINSNGNLDVWATQTGTDPSTGQPQIVLSDRATGLQSGSYIQVSDTANALTQVTGSAQAGQDAIFTVNGSNPALTSSSNTVTTAIPGVTLSLNGLTTSGTVTVDVSAPTTNNQNIQTAVQTFVSAYNAVITQIQTQLSQAPTSSDPTQGTLYGDSDLTDLLSNMRQAMYASGSGLPSAMASMLDIGVSTGASTGNAAPSQSALSGDLTLDASSLTSALESNPSGVQNMLASWAGSFSTLVNNEAGPGGTLDERIQGDSDQSSNIGNQIDNLNAANQQKEAALVEEFAQMESTLSQNQSESTWLTSQINALPTP